MNYRKELSEAFIDRDASTLTELKNKIVEDTMFLDQWFDLFIDKFSDLMDAEPQTAPVWKKYYQRFDEYTDLKIQLNTTEYYLKNV
jgi:hypothetical protein